MNESSSNDNQGRSRATRPAIKLGEMILENADPTVTWTRGPIKTPAARPAIKVEWAPEPEVGTTLELVVQADPAANAVDLASDIIHLIGRINALDRWLGGSGLMRIGGSHSNGTMTIKLFAE